MVEMGDGPHHCQRLKLGDAIVPFSRIQGSASICHRVDFSVILVLAEHSTQSLNGRIGFQNKLVVEIWVYQYWCSYKFLFELFEGTITLRSPFELDTFAG